MIFAELKTYLSQRGRAPLVDMATHFNSDPAAIRAMLGHYIQKGRVQRLDTGAACGGCSKCDVLALEIYEWVEGTTDTSIGDTSASCDISKALP